MNVIFAAIKNPEVHIVKNRFCFLFNMFIISKIVGVRDITLCYVANCMEYFISTYIISYYCFFFL